MIETERAKAGEDMQLTLDAVLEERVEAVMAELGETHTPRAATALVMDSRNGELLALANWPRADANDIGSAPEQARQNRAATAANVGSVKIGKQRFDKWGAQVRIRGADGHRPAWRGRRHRAEALRVLWLVAGQPPDRTGASGDTHADGRRLLGPRKRRGEPQTSCGNRRARQGPTRNNGAHGYAVSRTLEGVLAAAGTAQEASIEGYQLAGKTGTAEKPDPETGGYSEFKFFSSFSGYAPARDPRAARWP